METLRNGSSGPIVGLLQSILKTLGYYKDIVDNYFGSVTERGVRFFQKNFGIVSDGVVGENTWNKLMPYINGYFLYTVKRGDTIYNIARRYKTFANRITYANPEINSQNLFVGQKIIVPFGKVVKTDVSYSSEILELNIDALKIIYPFLQVESIGRSVLGKTIYCLKIGNGSKELFYNASIHANEWINTPMLMKFIENFSLAYENNEKIYDKSVREIFQTSTLYIVPMCNPDGVDLVTGAIKKDSNAYKNANAISNNYPLIPFPSGWKANINGVDLNLQFPAGWYNARKIKFSQGYTRPAPRDFVGEGPLTEPESLALYNFTLKHNFLLILTYHTQGRVIYWRYLNYRPVNSKEIGEEFSRISGYLLENTPYSSGFAGYKDWFIQNYNRPGYTIETGLGDNPLPIFQLNTIYNENEGILILAPTLVN